MSAWPATIQNALTRPSGARFVRCALQVNPFEYVKRHSRSTSFSTEAEYSEALVDALEQAGVEVIAITDHYRVKTTSALAELARSKGNGVLPGFEAAGS